MEIDDIIKEHAMAGQRFGRPIPDAADAVQQAADAVKAFLVQVQLAGIDVSLVVAGKPLPFVLHIHFPTGAS